jgi:transposase-like protein
MFDVTDFPARNAAMTKLEGKTTIAAVKELFAAHPDGLKEVVRAVLQELLETEMTEALGAEKGERSAQRLGYYGRTLITRVGKLELRVPQDRDGRFSTELFERYQRSDRALVATLAEMYVQGGLDPQGEGDHRGALRPRLLRLLHLRHQQAPGREPRHLCHPGRHLV